MQKEHFIVVPAAIPKSVPLILGYAFGFTFDESANEERKIPDFTIEGFADSAAHKNAEANGFKFISSEPTIAQNPVVTTDKKPASDTANVGLTQTAGRNRYVISSRLTVRYKSLVSREIASIRIPKSVKINGKKLTKSNVLTGAFKGISKKATFYLPRGKKASYKKIFLKRGAKKTMKFKTN